MDSTDVLGALMGQLGGGGISEIARSVIRASGVPLAVTSANPSGAEATVQSAEVLRTLGAWLEALVEPSRAASGVPSTVVDLTVAPPRLVREGAIGRELIEAVIGTCQVGE